ncbi:MAG: hypothetical protein IJU44_09780 [Kiritimatiellae bacterium]|nr:hypothetical protein [Kiritimatiellia bacterium]
MKMTVFACAVMCVGCSALAGMPKDNATGKDIVSRVRDIDGDGVIRVACVGDSITAGTEAFNYPKYLAECLDALGQTDGRKYAVRNHGKGAAAVRHVREKTDVNGDGVKDDYFYYDDPSYRSALTYTPDVVIIQMGTNDSLFDNWANWNNYFDRDYETYLVKPFRDKGSLIVISTPPYAQNGWHDQNVNGQVHDRVVALARKLGLPVVDTNRLLWGQPEILADGLHGNLTGYTLMAQNFYKHIFGGKLYTVSFSGEPQTRITLRDERTKRAYSRVLDRDGKGTLTFLPGAYLFHLSAEKPEFKREVRTFAAFQAGSEQKVLVTLRPGDFNYAPRGKPIQCDVKVYGGRHDCTTLNDGNRTKDGYQPDRWHAGDWCGIALDETAPIHSAVIYWETPEFISTYQDGGYNVFLKVKDEWRDVAALGVADVRRETYSGTVVADTLSFKTPIDAGGVKVVFKEGKSSHRYAPKVYEIELLSDVKPREPTVKGAETVDIPPFMKREPNGECAVTSVVKTVIQNGICSDFMLNVPCPENSLYQEIEWIDPPQEKLLKPYTESGDKRFFFTRTDCSEAPKIRCTYKVRFYRIATDFSAIRTLYPYDTSTVRYQDNVRTEETGAVLRRLPWLRESVSRLRSASGENPLAYARLAYAHVVTNFTYGLPSGEGEWLPQTVTQRKGDCGMLSEVYVALLRGGGVPARLMACFRPVKGQASHCWAEFYLERYGWFPVDVTFDLAPKPSYNHFGKYDDHTVVMTRGEDFKVESAGGRKFDMHFCQHYCYWYWNDAGKSGKPNVTWSFDAGTIK